MVGFPCVKVLLIKFFILNLNPALPWPNLGFIGDTYFASVTANGFTTCFSGCIFRSKLLPKPCTSGNFIPLDVVWDHFWTSYFSEFLHLYYNI